MAPMLRRRDVLRALLAGSIVPVPPLDYPQRRSVGIIGGGMAGVSLAWLLDGVRDVVLLEANDSLGGNIHEVEVELDGHGVVVDVGAQYFHPGPYPIYTGLLTQLGLHVPGSPEASQTHSFPASITVTADGEFAPRFLSPVVPDRLWPLFAWWNFAGLFAFGIGFIAASARERLNEDWTLTLDEWLPTLGFSRDQWEGMLLPWAASLFSGSIDQARGLSARAAMIFAAKALPPNPFDPIVYHVLKPGMGAVLQQMVGQLSTVQVMTRAKVLNVSQDGKGTFKLHCGDGRTFMVDDLVFASSGPATQRLLQGLPRARLQLAALRGLQFHPARLAIHRDPIYVPADPNLWSFFNCHAHGGYCEASMWLRPVLTGLPEETTQKLWKSWVTHRMQLPTETVYEAQFVHMLPTPATLLSQDAVRALQGRDRIWFAGGYLSPYDSQETALRSALRIAVGLAAVSSRSQTLLALLDPGEEI